MALEINGLRRDATGGEYIAPETICVTEDGELVDENDVRARTLLVRKGCAIPATDAARFGLIAPVAEETIAPAAEETIAAGPALEEGQADEPDEEAPMAKRGR